MLIRFPYRLGLDLGANSLGWCVLKLNEEQKPFEIVRMGSRIFRDGRNPKDKTSLAVARRQARQMRRRRDRFIKRRDRLLQALISHGFLPTTTALRLPLSKLDPYELRAKGLQFALTPYEFGRAIFHMNQRRGFKSNRKVDKGDTESGKIKKAISAAQQAITDSGARTIGEWLAGRHANRESVRARLRGQGAKAVYDLYVNRDMIADEFDQLFRAQQALQPQLYPEAAYIELRDVLLFQRRLRPVDPGRCTFEPEDHRAPIALPSVQRFRIYQEVNNLRVLFDNYEDRPLTLEERDAMVAELERNSKRSFSQLRKCLNSDRHAKFNLESEKRDHLKGDVVAVELSKAIGETWHGLPLAAQDLAIEKLISIENEEALIAELMASCKFSEQQARKSASAGLPDGYGSLGRIAIGKILPKLMTEVVTYDIAVINAGYQSHSDFYDGVVHEALPYYGEVLQRYMSGATGVHQDSDEKRYGRIANPTVHIGLNQVRTVVNAVIKRYGHPTQVVMEIARDLKMSKAQKDQIQKDQKLNQDRNDQHDTKLKDLGQTANGENRLRLRLWEELNKDDPFNRVCPYSGRHIGIDMLFSGEVEIEHILPFSRTLDDGANNKTLCLRQANRDKGEQTPFEAFGHSPILNGHRYDWVEINQRAQAFAKPKREKFAEKALEHYLREHADFLARHLTDTQYLSRAAFQYLTAICPKDAVYVVPGRLTSLLRGKWGLNKLLSDTDQKNRTDHRHHAIDAVVVAVTDRAMLQAVARASAKTHEHHLTKLIDRIPQPWEQFREALKYAVARIVISYKPDHGHQDQMHNDTAYGIVDGPDAKGIYTVVHRVPIDSFKKVENLADIRDRALQTRLRDECDGLTGKQLTERLSQFAEKTGIRRVRITERLNVIPIAAKHDKDSFYKAYKGDSNYCVEIYRDDKGEWKDAIVSTFDAYQHKSTDVLRNRLFAQNGKPLVMRLCKDDAIAVGEDDDRVIYRVAKFTDGFIALSEHFEANVDSRNRDKDDSFKYKYASASALLKQKARRVFVDPLGYVFDPGFKP